jgi:amino acid adenylation domain-containing protein
VFARSLPLAGELSIDTSFGDAMRRLSDAVRDATTWGECFDTRRLQAGQSERAPFVRFAFEDVRATGARHVAQDVTFDVEDTEARVDRFVLKLCADAGAQAIGDVWLEYDAAACHEDDARRLVGQFERLVASAMAAPDAAIGTLRLLPADQELEILARFGGTAWTAPAVELVHRRVEAQAARVPNATAVVYEGDSLTYAQLNDRANQLEHHLQALGVGADTLVGLCLERSVDVVVGMLGILKAGGAYVPLDPHLPAARLAGMIEDCRATVVVSRTDLAGLLPADVRTVLLDRDHDVLGAAPASNVDSAATPSSAVYVLFTSGSTGKPKGVAIEHRQLASYVDAVSTRLELPAGASYASVTTVAADLGNTAIFPALASGGCLHIVSEARASDPAAFADYFERHAIDVLKIVPSHLKALLSSSRPERVLPRKRLVLGGEACAWDLVDEVRRLAPDCTIVNHYGPTEATVGSTAYVVPPDAARPQTATVPIGAPLDHARARVVDGHLQLVPLWVAGELCIGGAGVARGYLASPDLTREKFVADPWGTGGERMYRTGDRVRMRPDGTLEFIGRTDNQVKVRGFRVEIGEVEAALRRHSRTKDVAVLAHDDGTGMRLTAFLVYRDAAPLPADLKAFLTEHGLPEYMIPAAFVGLDALPLTANGKLDRQRLLASLDDLVSAQGTTNEPLTEWESLVAGIWQELLGVDDIQPRDNFYDLGGHSLLAIQVVTALEKRARVQVSPRDLVFHTLKQFAALCESKSVQHT